MTVSFGLEAFPFPSGALGMQWDPDRACDRSQV
jgi:hypothetical protein